MKRFSCLGAECEETCCAGWTVHLKGEDVRRMKDRFEVGSAMREEVDAAVLPILDGRRTEDAVAELRYFDSTCSLLSAEGLCRVHLLAGHGALSDPCALFPRVLRKIDGEVEMSSALSCPESARLIATWDDACQWEDEAEDAFDRWDAARPLELSEHGERGANFFFVRDKVHQSLAQKAKSFEACFADALDFAREHEEGEPNGGGIDRTPQEVEQRLHDGLIALMGSVRDNRLDRFRRGLQENRQLDASVAQRICVENFPSLWSRWAKNVAINFLISEPHLDAPSLLAHLCRIAIQIGALRLMVFCHPAFSTRWGQADAPAENEVEARVIETLHAFGRYLMSVPDVRVALWELADGMAETSPDQAALLHLG
jgi:hypothetical protein